MLGDTVYLTIAGVLYALWILGFGLLHVAGGLIHLLVVLAAVAVIWHLVAGGSDRLGDHRARSKGE
jgi:hypothetical protein